MVAKPVSLDDAFRGLGLLLLAEEPLEATLSRVAELACRALRSCDHASVVLIRDGRSTPAAGSEPEGEVRALLSVPLLAGGEQIGVLNLYSTTSDSFSDDDVVTARLFGEQAAVACANADVYWRCRELTEHLREAVETRDVIGQAKGILMARHAFTPDQAFDALRTASMQRNVKLRVVAEEVVYLGDLIEG